MHTRCPVKLNLNIICALFLSLFTSSNTHLAHGIVQIGLFMKMYSTLTK